MVLCCNLAARGARRGGFHGLRRAGVQREGNHGLKRAGRGGALSQYAADSDRVSTALSAVKNNSHT